MDLSRNVHAACPHDCPDTCAIRVTVENGVAIRVQGDPEHPPTHGALCTKVARYTERTYHPERLLHPLRRTGAKGGGRFERITWDEALDEIASRLREIAARDPQAILPYSYAGTMGLVQGDSMSARFFHRLGASQLDRTICASAGATALKLTYGRGVGMLVEHYRESRLILIWGSNSIASNLHFWSFAQEAKRNGAKLVCIDPRRTETADKCHQHIALMPGTDGALALGLIRELAERDLLDRDYLERHTDGWRELVESAREWTPERTADVCGITAEEVRALARDYGSLRPAAIRLNYGMQRVRGGGSAVRLIAALPCLIGAWRHRAGGLLLSASGFAPTRPEALERPDLMPTPRPRVVNMSTIGDALLAPASADFGPRIEALVVYNSNPVAVAPESPKVVKGFAREDLFTVVIEQFQTDTADYADIVLPATTQLEHFDVHKSYGHTYVLVNEPAIAPLGEARPNTAVFRALAGRLGFTEDCFADDDERIGAQAFGDAVDFARLRREGWVRLPIDDAPFASGGFPTPNGRAQFAPPGIGVAGYVPPYESPASAPELARRFPLAMISPPARHFLNSTFVNVRSLRSIEGEPLLEMNPRDATQRGLRHGSIVRIFNDRGEYRCRMHISERARPGVVVGLGVWWRKLGVAGSNTNELTHQRLTDIGRAPTFYDCLVEVAAA
ncbi:MAG: molybdopterin oxidoreductase family protein [Gammaproteobacteria bacterium]|nr:molybdopterin oxidoreductase family protein [Gammaproteobacteria bacterium]